jgi:long-chain acyl-CoA synthetase
VLKKGGVLLIHPEGTRSPDGQLLPFKPGATLLANHISCPIVPVFIEGSHEFWPKGRPFPARRSFISLTIGKPMPPDPRPAEAQSPAEAAFAAERAAHRLRERMRSLAEEGSPALRPWSAAAATRRIGCMAAIDVDGTLVKWTILHYYAFFVRRLYSGWRRRLAMASLYLRGPVWLLLDKWNRPAVVASIYRLYRGLPAEKTRALASTLFREEMSKRLNHTLIAALEEHRRNGEQIVLLSGSLDFILEPLARFLGADALLATSLEEGADGRFSGRLSSPLLVGDRKVEAILRYARRHDLDLSRSSAYADDVSDFPMLEIVGHPTVVNPGPKLKKWARRLSWPTLPFGEIDSPAHRGGPSRPPETMRDLFLRAVRLFKDDVAFEHRRDAEWARVTYSQLGEEAQHVSSFLFRSGIARAEPVAILSENRPEWAAAAFGALNAGAVCLPLDSNLDAAELANLVSTAECRLVFTSRKHLKAATQVRALLGGRLDVVCFDPVQPGEGVREWGVLRSQPHVPFDSGAIPIEAEDPAFLLFTSGTTDRPKGVVLSHRNVSASAWWTWKETGFMGCGSRLFCVLPLHHIFPLTVGMIVCLLSGATLIFASTLKPNKMLEELRASRPDTLLAVPLLLESLYRGILRTVKAGSIAQRSAFRIGLRMAGTLPVHVRRRLFARLQSSFGSDLRYISCGGASLDAKVLDVFERLGWAVCQGYGLTETAPVVATNTPKARRAGSVGRPLPHMEVRIADPDEHGVGEIQVRGHSVMTGYFKNPMLTERSRVDGWLRTGDLGSLDSAGFLYIRGRSKDVIVTPGGKKIYPEDLEARYTCSPYIKEICIFEEQGDGRRYSGLHAFVVPDGEAIRLAGAADADGVRAVLQREIVRLEAGQPLYTRLNGFTLSWDELDKTSLRKTKRHAVIQKHRSEKGEREWKASSER